MLRRIYRRRKSSSDLTKSIQLMLKLWVKIDWHDGIHLAVDVVVQCCLWHGILTNYTAHSRFFLLSFPFYYVSVLAPINLNFFWWIWSWITFCWNGESEIGLYLKKKKIIIIKHSETVSIKIPYNGGLCLPCILN